MILTLTMHVGSGIDSANLAISHQVLDVQYAVAQILLYLECDPNRVMVQAGGGWLAKVTGGWQAGHISNLDYLLYCNLAAGRSFNDLTQVTDCSRSATSPLISTAEASFVWRQSTCMPCATACGLLLLCGQCHTCPSTDRAAFETFRRNCLVQPLYAAPSHDYCL